MLADCHIHTSFSGDSNTPPRDEAESAIRLGIPEICITDHHDYGSEGMCAINFILDIPRYLEGLRKLQDEYAGRLRVYKGIELGLMMRVKDRLESLEKSLDMDYVIGSCHFVDGIDVYDREFYVGRSEKASYRRFFESTLERVRAMDCFDSLGHLDFVVRYGPTKNINYRPEEYRDIIDEILRTLLSKGKALECNSAGFKYGLGHANPHEWILRRYRELGGELITVGSDAHRPAELAFAFDRVAEILKDCGYRYYTVYRGRKPYMELIP